MRKNQSNQTAQPLSAALSPRIAGSAFTLTVFAGLIFTLLLSLTVSAYAASLHITFDAALTKNPIIWLSFLFPQIALLLACIGTLCYARVKPVFLPRERVRATGVTAAALLWFGLLFGFGQLNEYFVRFLGLFGYVQPAASLPVMDTFWQYLISVLVIAALPALAEEFLFRGMLLSASEGAKTWVRILLCGLLFCVFHQNPAQTPYQFLCGVAFAYLTVKTGNVFLAVGAHFMNNFYILTAAYLGLPAFAPWLSYLLTGLGILSFAAALFLLYFRGKKVEEVQGISQKTLLAYTLPGLSGCVCLWIINFVSAIGG